MGQRSLASADPRSSGNMRAACGAPRVKIGLHEIVGKWRLEPDRFAAVKAFPKPFEFVESRERGVIHPPDLAGHSVLIIRIRNQAGILSEIDESKSRNGSRVAAKSLPGQAIMIAAAAFERAVDKHELTAGNGHGFFGGSTSTTMAVVLSRPEFCTAVVTSRLASESPESPGALRAISWSSRSQSPSTTPSEQMIKRSPGR